MSSAKEDKILEFWKQDKTFDKSVNQKTHSKSDYIFFDGPPFANGLPHYGHLLTGFVKDVFARYHTNFGSKCSRKFGWDCHGLPAEMESEKELKISGRLAIKEHGIENFNNHCKESVMKYANEWEYYVTRQGRWVDFQNSYKTMDLNYMESVTWAFAELFKKGLIYESLRVMPYSWKVQTPLSNFETRMDNSYRQKESKTAVVKFKILDNKVLPSNTFALSWTTTPWTLPSNLALAVGGEIEYSLVSNGSSNYLIAKDLFLKYQPEIIGDLKIQIAKNIEKCLQIRKSVFQDEQKVPQNLDFDEFDKSADVTHYEILHKNQVIGTARSRNTEKGIKIERFAILKEYRKLGYGKIAFIRILSQLEYGKSVVINAQTYLKDFYNGIGFTENGSVFQECGIEHIEMKMEKNRYIFKGSELAGLKYEPLFPFFKNNPNSFQVLIGDFVSTEDGTGIVHIAPGFGEDDFTLCQKNDIPILCPVNDAGEFDHYDIIDLKYNLADKEYLLKLTGRCVLELQENGKYDGVNEDVIKYLKSQDLWLKTEQYFHNYPHCWRTDTPLIYKAVSSWYVNVTDPKLNGESIKDRMVRHNQNINWIPDHVKDGQFGKWIANARDWSISRNRFFGTCIPVWKGHVNICQDVRPELLKKIELLEENKSNPLQLFNGTTQTYETISNENDLNAFITSNNGNFDYDLRVNDDVKEIWVQARVCFGSIAELEPFFKDEYIDGSDGVMMKNQRREGHSRKYATYTGNAIWEFSGINDLHRPYIDELRIDNNYMRLERIEDVFDCWFESGSMPFASVHYPFNEESKSENGKPKVFPADFIVEYVAQTRGWFYTLMVLSCALFDEAPFKNCICHGVILDSNGEKLSKRLRNYPDPKDMFEKYGSDAMRWFMLSSPVMYGRELYMDKDGEQIKDAFRMIVTPFVNASNFFVMYAKIDNIKCQDIIHSNNTIIGEMNKYIIEVYKDTANKIHEYVLQYNTPAICKAFEEFLDALNNWYIRRSKDIFWQSGNSEAKQEAFNTLYSVLLNSAQIIAPILPMTTEGIFQEILEFKQL